MPNTIGRDVGILKFQAEIFEILREKRGLIEVDIVYWCY
jgi:hypothetical protein